MRAEAGLAGVLIPDTAGSLKLLSFAPTVLGTGDALLETGSGEKNPVVLRLEAGVVVSMTESEKAGECVSMLPIPEDGGDIDPELPVAAGAGDLSMVVAFSLIGVVACTVMMR